MNRRQLLLTPLVLVSLACNFFTRLFISPATPTPTPTVLTPAYIPPECAAVPPATVPAATALAQPTPELQANPDIDAKQRLQVFDEVVRIIEDVYVYPDFNGQNWPEIVSTYRAKIHSGTSTEAFYSDMKALVSELGDEHSFFESPVEVAASEAELAGSTAFVGIGVSALPHAEKGTASLIAVRPDSPAERSGLRAHDSILLADGLPIVEGDQVYTHRVRGPECSAVRLTVQSPGQAPRDILIIRVRIEGGQPVEARLLPTSDGSKVGYIFMPTFFDRTIPDQMQQALKDFGRLDGLILDNRMNGGGSSDVVEPVLAFFISGKLGEFTSRTESRPLAIQASPIENSQEVPLVVLVGEETVSFGEVFAGVLKDSGRAQIVGQTTLGNVEILFGHRFPDGSQLWLAQETFIPAASLSDWEATGIIPDVQAYAEWDTFTFETDPSIAAALTLLGHGP